MTGTELKPRMRNVVAIVPEAMHALQAFSRSAESTGISPATTMLVTLRASQINACSVCVELHSRSMRESGESEERIAGVAAWRHMPYFSAAERAALALTEAVTRLSDRSDPVPDTVWNEARQQFNEAELAGLLIGIAAINAWNRLNVATGQVAGVWKPEGGEWRTAPPPSASANGSS